MGVTGGRLVVTPGEARPYKVVLEHEPGGDTEHPVGTVREGELYIRSKRPVSPGAAFDFGNSNKSAPDAGGWDLK
jgi:hypothetical protein